MFRIAHGWMHHTVVETMCTSSLQQQWKNPYPKIIWILLNTSSIFPSWGCIKIKNNYQKVMSFWVPISCGKSIRLWREFPKAIVILNEREGSRRHPRGCEILPPYGRQNDKRVKDNSSLVAKRRNNVRRSQSRIQQHLFSRSFTTFP